MTVISTKQVTTGTPEDGRAASPAKRFLRKVVPTSARRNLRVVQWRLRGSPTPPPHYFKQQTLKKVARKYELRDLVETGTFLGDMLAAMRDSFDSLTSIELSEELHARAVQRFAGDDKITLLQGDSKDRISEVSKVLDRPTLFWLDAHYSGSWHAEFEETAGGDRDNPIYAELEAVFERGIDHAVLIDDARLFNGKEGWPILTDVCLFVKERQPTKKIHIEHDIVRILPR